jgi:hypothetical protein
MHCAFETSDKWAVRFSDDGGVFQERIHVGLSAPEVRMLDNATIDMQRFLSVMVEEIVQKQEILRAGDTEKGRTTPIIHSDTARNAKFGSCCVPPNTLVSCCVLHVTLGVPGAIKTKSKSPLTTGSACSSHGHPLQVLPAETLQTQDCQQDEDYCVSDAVVRAILCVIQKWWTGVHFNVCWNSWHQGVSSFQSERERERGSERERLDDS